MRSCEFSGKVVPDTAPQLILPGRDILYMKPDDWPARIAPGTLSVQVSGFPASFAEVGDGVGFARLDEWKFTPALMIPQRFLIGSTLTPDEDQPARGFAGIWRANLHVIDTRHEETCWAMRILGSDDTTVIQLVAEEDLRRRLILVDGASVRVMIWEQESHSKLPTPEEIVRDWCEAARNVEQNYGREKAMGYLIGEKFLRALDWSERNHELRLAIPIFVAGIKELFEPRQLAEYLNTPRRLGVLGHVSDEKGHRLLRAAWEDEERIREDARNLVLLEWAKELLLEQEE